MINMGNLGGTLYYMDIPICEFKYSDDTCIKIVELDKWSKYHPPLLTSCTDKSLRLFAEDQLIPESREGLLKGLRSRTPILEYNPEQILRWFLFQNTQNPYWVEMDSDVSCWEDSEEYEKYRSEFPVQRGPWTY